MLNRVLEKFRRVSSQRYMAEVDGLRFLAIVPVLLLHFRTAFLRYNDNYSVDSLGDIGKIVDKILLTGDIGVPIFFAISGFILSLPFANHYINGGKKVNVKRYFLRRLTRLEPPYIITLLLLFMVHVFMHTKPLGELVDSLLASLIYSHNWIFGTWSTINPVAWSLEIEVQFYIIVPLITLLFAIKNKHLKFVFFILLLLTFPLLNSIYSNHILSLLGFGQYFVVGIIVAAIYQTYKSIPFNKNLLDIAGLISIILIFVFKYFKIYYLIPVVIFIGFIAVLYGNRINKLFSNQFISVVGGMCYITYLIHYSVITGLMMIFPEISLGLGYWADFVLYGVIIIPIVITVSGFAFLLLEKPFMNHEWPQNFRKFVVSRFHSQTNN